LTSSLRIFVNNRQYITDSWLQCGYRVDFYKSFITHAPMSYTGLNRLNIFLHTFPVDFKCIVAILRNMHLLINKYIFVTFCAVFIHLKLLCTAFGQLCILFPILTTKIENCEKSLISYLTLQIHSSRSYYKRNNNLIYQVFGHNL